MRRSGVLDEVSDTALAGGASRTAPGSDNRNDLSGVELTAISQDPPATGAHWRELRLVDRSIMSTHLIERHVPVALRDEPNSASFFHLVSVIERLAGDQKVIGITSSVGGEGKTTTALHLATCVARSSYRRVCLVDLSLGEDELCRRAGAAPAPSGLMNLIENDSVFSTLVWPGPEQLQLLPAGRAPLNASRVARSPRVVDLLAALRSENDLVIVDLPSVSSDNATALSAHLDGVVMVVRAGATPRDVVRESVDTLGHNSVIGVVLNRTTSGRRGLTKWGKSR